MPINPDEIHIIQNDLTQAIPNEWEILSLDEQARANRYRFAIHKKRFVTARAGLRVVLAQYLLIPPDEIVFTYDEYEKPALYPTSPLYFNVSHSDDLAVYAIRLHHPLGIDLERIKADYYPEVAKRYFSQEEILALELAADQDKSNLFYRIWARKEALVKAIGKGFSMPFRSFSVPLDSKTGSVYLDDHLWHMIPLEIHPQYEAALAISPLVKSLSYLTLLGSEFEWEKQYLL